MNRWFISRPTAGARRRWSRASARRSLDVEAYEFTSAPIASALLAAHARGVAVRVIVDARASHQKGAQAGALLAGGIALRRDAQHAIFHDKVLLCDAQSVATGSFNYSAGAEHRNAENLLLLPPDPALAARYEADFEKHWAHAGNF